MVTALELIHTRASIKISYNVINLGRQTWTVLTINSRSKGLNNCLLLKGLKWIK